MKRLLFTICFGSIVFFETDFLSGRITDMSGLLKNFSTLWMVSVSNLSLLCCLSQTPSNLDAFEANSHDRPIWLTFFAVLDHTTADASMRRLFKAHVFRCRVLFLSSVIMRLCDLSYKSSRRLLEGVSNVPTSFRAFLFLGVR